MARLDIDPTKLAPKKFVHAPGGELLCPWCHNQPPISTCPHDPFTLMDKIKEQKKQIKALSKYRCKHGVPHGAYCHSCQIGHVKHMNNR